MGPDNSPVNKHLVAIILCLISVSASGAQEPADRERWQACRNAAECVPALDECNGAAAVNRQFQTQYGTAMRQLRQRVDCAQRCFSDEGSLQEHVRSVGCENQKCSIEVAPQCPGRNSQR